MIKVSVQIRKYHTVKNICESIGFRLLVRDEPSPGYEGRQIFDWSSGPFSHNITDQSSCKVGLNLAVNACAVRILHDDW